MAVTVINVGTSANDNTGDTLRNAFIKTNTNFDILSTTSKLGNGDLQINGINIGKGGGTTYGNTSIGLNTLTANTTQSNNVAVGFQSMQIASTNTSTAVGVNSLQDCSGDRNVGVGVNTLLITEGLENTAIGSYSMQSNTTGYDNVALGYDSLVANISGYRNSAIGKQALSGNTTFFNSTGLGYNAQVEGSNQIQLGSGTTTCYTNGAVQNRSDLRDKTEVRNTVLGLDFINELRPVDYKWDMREDYRSEMPSQLDLDATEEEKAAHQILMDEWLESVKLENITQDGTNTRTRYHHGLIAQEVQDLIEASGVDFGGFQDHKVNGGGDVLSIGYTELIAPMIKAIQELTARINVLEGN
jgi:hypothetical protein